MARRRRTNLGQGDTCTWPGGVGPFSVGYGANALAYLRRRTAQDPWFAVVSGIMHAGQIDYNIQQPIAERLLKHPPEVAFDMERVFKLTEGAQDRARVVGGLGIGAHCYRRFCKDKRDCTPGSGKLSRNGERLIECLRTSTIVFTPAEIDFMQRAQVKDRPIGPRGEGGYTYKSLLKALQDRKRVVRVPHGSGWGMRGAGLGAKTRNLVAEYMGCDDAVAVDRHVGNWLANSTGRLAWVQRVKVTKRDSLGRNLGKMWLNKPVMLTRSKSQAKRLRSQGFPAVDSGAVGGYPTFGLLKRELQEMARECGVAPATLQVAAWAQNVCEGERKGKGANREIYLGEGKTDSCSNVPRLNVPLSDWAALVRDRPRSPGERFACAPGYLGGAAAPAAPLLPLYRAPLRPPPGEFWKVRFVGKPFPVRVIPEDALRPGAHRPARAAARPAQAAMMVNGPGRLGRRLIDGD
jgi:hypothetical protein